MCSKLCVNNKKDLAELRKIHADLTEKTRVRFWILESAKKFLLKNAGKLDVDGLKKAKQDLKTAKMLHTRAFNLEFKSQWDDDGFPVYSDANLKKDEGKPELIKFAVEFIKKHGFIKDESPNKCDFI